jgi:hypothetical protein
MIAIIRGWIRDVFTKPIVCGDPTCDLCRQYREP